MNWPQDAATIIAWTQGETVFAAFGDECVAAISRLGVVRRIA